MGWWILLFPTTYWVHIAEECWGGFAARIAEATGVAISDGAFLAANALLWTLMATVVVLVLRSPSRAPLVVALATVVTINAAVHAGGTLLAASYSPGLVSAVLLWLPLGVMTLVRGHRVLAARSFRSGVLIGVVAHAFVPLIAMGFALAPRG